MNKIVLQRIPRTSTDILLSMQNHYSSPKGFVGRNICYRIIYEDLIYGHIVGGSATKFLPGRDKFFNFLPLNNIVNNIFYHIQPGLLDNKYPTRNFTSKVVEVWMETIANDWLVDYDDKVVGFETLVELPRTGELYKRIGYEVTGITKGYTCKREAGKGTDSWSGKRVWNTTELSPKLVLCKWWNREELELDI